jgi:hypothetical protein
VRRKDKELVPVAEFATVEESERVWSALEQAGVPSSVVTDPEVLGQVSISRVWVERFNLEAAKDLVAELLSED